MSETNTKSGRRQFLKSAAVAGGAASVAAAGSAVLADATPEPAIEEPKAQDKLGYHVTPHIDTYYRLARD